MTFDSQKHHRRSIRLRGYDYAQSGAYFVTICAARKRCVFGKIENDEVRLNPYGKIVLECWLSLTEHYSHIELDKYVLMPNHFHGILIINEHPVGAGFSRPEFSDSPESPQYRHENRAGEPRPYKATLGK